MVNNNFDMKKDRIAQLFNGKVIFITGGSGFVGKVLIEKLLRCCPEIKTIYLLLRNKKNKPPSVRVQEIFEDPLFDLLQDLQPNAAQKCIAIPGDVSEINLGISDSDRKLLQNEVEFIYHSAASTRFDEPLKDAVKLNTRGTKCMIELAHQCINLKIFVHVSTSYVHPEGQELEEKVYDPPADPYEVLKNVERTKDDSIDLEKKYLGSYPNTYVFSKALAEALIAEEFNKLPVIIVRPSFVTPIWREPLPGWCDTIHGPMGLFPGIGKGVIRTIYINGATRADFIPADIAINAILLTTWNFFTKKDLHVYNITSSKEQRYTWKEGLDVIKEITSTIMPFNNILWCPGFTLRETHITHNIAFFLFQTIPAIFLDAILKIFNQKPFLHRIQQRIDKTSKVLEFYTMKTWRFSNNNVVAIRDVLNEEESETYKIDSENFDLKDYFIGCVHSMRVLKLKEMDDMLPTAQRNVKIMKILDKIVKTLVALTLLHIILKYVVIPFCRL